MQSWPVLCFLHDGAKTPFKIEYLKVCALLSNVVFAVGTQQRSSLTEENASGRTKDNKEE